MKIKISRRSEQAHSTKDKRIRLVGTCRKVPLVQNGIAFILENAYLTYLGFWRSVTQKTFTRFCQPAILKRVSGFCNDIFYEDGTLTHRPLPNPEGQALQFIWPFTHNLPSTVYPTRDQGIHWHSFQGHEGTQTSLPRLGETLREGNLETSEMHLKKIVRASARFLKGFPCWTRFLLSKLNSDFLYLTNFHSQYKNQGLNTNFDDRS